MKFTLWRKKTAQEDYEAEQKKKDEMIRRIRTGANGERVNFMSTTGGH